MIVIGVRSTRSVVVFGEKMFTILVFKIVGPKIRLCTIFENFNYDLHYNCSSPQPPPFHHTRPRGLI